MVLGKGRRQGGGRPVFAEYDKGVLGPFQIQADALAVSLLPGFQPVGFSAHGVPVFGLPFGQQFKRTMERCSHRGRHKEPAGTVRLAFAP